MKINLWKLSFLLVVPASLVLMLWLMITLPVDNPELFLKLIIANSIAIPYVLYSSYKALVD